MGFVFVMFQPKVKLEFVRRYCAPKSGWRVFVDIDASEEGRTGGDRTTTEARQIQELMRTEGASARRALGELGVHVGGNRRAWATNNELPVIEGDRDIVVFHVATRRCLIAEVEGKSTGQPEQKLYKAIGQIVMATGHELPNGWDVRFVLVVNGDAISRHLDQARTLEKLGISGLSLDVSVKNDRWAFGKRLSLKSA